MEDGVEEVLRGAMAGKGGGRFGGGRWDNAGL